MIATPGSSTARTTACCWPEPMILHWQASREAVAFYESLGLEADRVGDYPRYPGFSLDLRGEA
ncbi:hypothetical protein [Microlunatus parietis]|uniref:Uncharacterized protein n=1 Tax=Microlunatus parietis TaxID=682979 RepID=A0A7Y9LCC5_9ACTN|nr:hypothetical protein [Microlunatus parietis]NYE71565.1 hypothetical protein [Microlunatus parietis]